MPAPLQVTTPADLDVVARTLYGEAASEGWDGMVAVAWVIRTRWQHSKRWPESPAEVCLEPLQFSCWNSNQPVRTIIQGLSGTNVAFRDAIAIAGVLCADRLAQLTASANVGLAAEADHYYATYIDPPAWADKKKVMTTIGKHIFLKLQET